MRPREQRETGKQDLFRSRLDQIIDTEHALVKLARTVDWRFLEEKFGAVYKDGPGQPPLPTRLMAGLATLKHTYNLSDEVMCELWLENPYYQYFCGEEFFQHRLPLDRSSMTHWRNRMGEERLQALLQESLAVATRTGAMKPGDLARVIVDTTVQPKNITFPTDAKLLNRAREKLVKLAKKAGRGATVVLHAGRQVRPDPASALRPCQAVQARQAVFAQAQDPSRPRHSRHCPQDRR
jgi:transposase, IS5 family